MKTIYFFLLFINFSPLFAQDSCVVKLHLGDCRLCYVPLQMLSDTTTYIRKMFVVKEADKFVIKKFLRDELNIEYDYSIVISDSLYINLGTNPQSEIFFYHNKEIIYKSLLREFNGDKKFLLSKVHKINSIPDSIFLSNQLVLSVNNGKIIIKDQLFNALIVFDADSGILLKLIEFNKFSPETFFEELNVDSVSRRYFIENKTALESIGVLKVQFLGDDLMNDNESLLYCLTIRVPFFSDSTNSLLLKSRGLLQLTKTNSDEIQSFSIDKILNHNKINTEYKFAGGPFQIFGDSILFIARTKILTDSLFLIKISFLDDSIHYSENLLIPFPQYYLQESIKNYEMLLWDASFPYLISKRSNEIYDISTNVNYTLPFQFDKVKDKKDLFNLDFDYYLIDLFYEEDTIFTLHQSKNYNKIRFFLCTYESHSMKLINKLEIVFPQELGVSYFSFLDRQTLIGLNNKREFYKIFIPQ